VQIRGPYAVTGLGNTPSRRRVFVCRPISAEEETPCARRIIAALARRGTPMKLVLSRRVDFPLRTTFFSPWKYGQADRIIAVSDAVRRVLLKGGVSGERVVIIPDGVVSESPAADRTDGVTFPSGSLRTMLGVAPETSVVGIVAALAPHKDYPTFLRAAERVADQIPSVHFVIVGEGHLRSTLEAEASRRGLASRVHFLGFREDTRPLMIAFDVVVLSSKEEGLGSVLLEAMALGKPIAATTAGGIPEVVADGKTGLLVPPRDPQALADVILRLLRDSTLREQLGEAARIAVQRFSVDRMVDATERVYAEILGGGGGQKRSERSHAHRQTASRVSAVVMTKNEEHNIEECLKRLTWTDEIVVVDDCSTDRTIAGARRFTSKVIQHRGEGFGPQKQFAIDQAQGEWVLLIDADERVSPALAEEIRRILARGSQEGGALVENGFFIPFQLVFLGRRLRFGGLGRERHLRLFRKTAARIVFRPVHEEIVVSAPVGTLSSSIEHESYRDLKEYWSKCDWYTTLAAQGLLAEGARAHWWDRLHVPWELFRRVVLYGAWLDGWRGLVYAGLSAYYVWLKYQKLRRLSPHAR
ncbi:MAG: glycosyltransferase, partial [Elusimicrobia bacterium]|nr:glycosyltransferase [Elusimicrobiota bacterium]